jgi:hypothetical protein
VVGPLFDQLGQRLADAVAGARFDPEQDGMLGLSL